MKPFDGIIPYKNTPGPTFTLEKLERQIYPDIWKNTLHSDLKGVLEPER